MQVLGTRVFPQGFYKERIVGSKRMDPKHSMRSDMGLGKASSVQDRKGKGVTRKKGERHQASRVEL